MNYAGSMPKKKSSFIFFLLFFMQHAMKAQACVSYHFIFDLYYRAKSFVSQYKKSVIIDHKSI